MCVMGQGHAWAHTYTQTISIARKACEHQSRKWIEKTIRVIVLNKNEKNFKFFDREMKIADFEIEILSAIATN